MMDAMSWEAAMVLRVVAAGLFGGAVLLLALAAWQLIQPMRAGIGGGAAGRGSGSMRRAEMRELARGRSAPFRFFEPYLAGLAITVERLGLEPLRQYIRRPYVRAGYPGGLEDEEVVAAGAILAGVFVIVIGFVAVGLFGVGLSWVALMGLPLGFVALVAHLQSQAEERERDILRALPYALDLLVLMVRSGTSLRMALGRVVDDYAAHPLGIELGQVLAEMDVGATRADAFKKMADRLKIPDVTALVDAIVQSEELGWPLADTLERLADRITAERILRAQATAGAAGVYVMLPSTLVLLSAVLLLFAPFIVNYLVTGSIV
jgi:tight adherence protein C